MTRTRTVFFVILLAAIGLGVLLWYTTRHHGDDDQTSIPPPPPSPPGTVEVLIENALTKQRWFEELAKNFQAEGRKTSKGNSIVITSKPVLSGKSLEDILDGKLRPVVWSPGVESYVQDLDERWKRGNNGQTLMSAACRPTVYAPLGIAMWRPMAEALGWPDKPIGWKTIVDLAAAPEGWSTLGHPEWGRFKLGYPHPVYSNVGMLFMTAFVYGVEGKTAGLQAADVYASEVKTSMHALAQKTTKYGMVSLKLLDAMAEHADFLDAVAAFENDTVQYNIDKKDQLRFPLAFIFPSEGTFWTDQPYCIFDKAAWVSDEQAEAAKLFLDYLLQREQQTLAVKSLMRPLDSTIPLTEPLDLAHGTDPRVMPGTVPSLPIPNPDLMRAVNDVFLITKRKATVLVVLDLSGSMQGEKIQTGTNATANFLKRLQPNDVVGVMTFSDKDKVQMLNPPQPASDVAEALSQRVTNLIAGGGTALYDAVCAATEKMKKLKSTYEAAGENRLYGIVLLSDGKDTSSEKTENEMFSTCLPGDPEAQGVRINAIAFGADADQPLLKHIAEVTGGNMFRADPDSIDDIYLNISAEQ